MSAILSQLSEKMTSYNVYPDLPKKPSSPLVPQFYWSNTIRSKQQGLLELKERYSKKYFKYSKTLHRLLWLNACSSVLTVATGISSMAPLSTFIGLPVSIPFGVVSLAGTSVSGVTAALASKYQKKLSKVSKLVDTITSAIAVFETSVLSEALDNGKIDERVTPQCT